jgi:hypothetical protein
MQMELKRRPADSDGGVRTPSSDERRELTLLAEFMRHNSVASLAGDIAERLGADARGEDLIAAAGLGDAARARRLIAD